MGGGGEGEKQRTILNVPNKYNDNIRVRIILLRIITFYN